MSALPALSLASTGPDPAAIVERLSVGVLVISDAGLVTMTNSAGRALLSARDGLVLERDRVRGSTPAATRGLGDAIAAARGGAGEQPVVLPRRGARPLTARAVSLRPASPAVMLLFTDPDRRPVPSVDVLEALHGLTTAEARVARLLMQGRSLREIGAALDISIHTARTHLRRVLGKTGARRQGELVHVLWSAAMVA